MALAPEDVTAARTTLGLTQVEVATLLGCSSLTVSRWERGVAAPGDYMIALLRALGEAGERWGELAGGRIRRAIMTGGAIRGLHRALCEAFGPPPGSFAAPDTEEGDRGQE